MLYVGTDRGLFTLEPAAPARWPDHAVSALARCEQGLMAVLDGHDIVTLSERSKATETIARIEQHEVFAMIADTSGAWLGTEGAHLYRVADGRVAIVNGFESAPDRERWYTPWGGPPDTRSLASGNPRTIYVNVHVGGIVRSRDGGSSWEPTIDVDADVHQVVTDPADARRVVAATARGFAMSDDGGDTWRFDNAGLEQHYLRAVCVTDDAILVSASRGPHSGGGRLHRRIGRNPFVQCRDGLPEQFDDNIDTHWLVAAGQDVAAGGPDGSIHASHDGGRSWQRLATGLPSLRCLIWA